MHERLPRPDSLPMLLVAVNLLMLCFFVLLNALATAPSAARDKHMRSVLAQVQEGYNIQGPAVAEDGTTPTVPTTPWAVEIAGQLQGVVLNRLRLTTAPLEADASRVVLTLPANSIFSKDALVGTETIRALMLAAQGTQQTWQVRAPAEKLALWGSAIAELTGQVSLQVANTEELRLVVRPSMAASPMIGRGLESISVPQGATVQGEATP